MGQYTVARLQLTIPCPIRVANVPPPQRVVLHGLVSGSGTSADTLVVSFTVNYANKVTSARIDVLEQDEHFVTVRTLNYTLPPETYNVSRLCIGGLDSKAQYLVCLRVEYSGSGEDSTCSRNVTSEKASLNDLKCQPPTSVMKVVNSQDGNPASTPGESSKMPHMSSDPSLFPSPLSP